MTGSAGNKWALLIGINRYANLAPQYQLSGCVNDVGVMHSLLADKFLFPGGNITVLRDQEATQECIRKAMDALAGRVGPKDIVVVHYSGHGSLVTDIHGDEPSGMDSTIVPHDSGRGQSPNRDITDDEIHLWLSRLTRITPHVTLIFDCCHSGTIARDAFGDASRWVPPDSRSAAEITADGTAFRPPGEALHELIAANRTRGGSGWLALGRSYVLLAGCRDEESSFEYTADGATYGALSYFLSRELFDAAPGATTYRDVFERASARVTSCHPRQHPQIEGRQDRLVFDTREVEPMRFVTVMSRRGNGITLGAGAAHGLTAGSQWAVYPQGTKTVTPETVRSGLVEITAVHAVTSEAGIIGPDAPGAITAGCRAVEEAHACGNMRLVVDVLPLPVSEGHEEALITRIRGSRLLELAAPEDSTRTAELRVYLVPPRMEVTAGDPVPELVRIEKPTWAAVGRDGRLAMPARPADEPGAMDVIIENLEKRSRYRNALLLTNPGSTLKGKVAFVLKRRSGDGSWEVAQADPASGQVVFDEDDPIAFEIVNRHTAPIFVSVLDFGLAGSVSLLYPPGRASDRVLPGTSVKLFEREEDRLELFIPEEFAYDDGLETVKLFATTSETDFGGLEQPSVRSARDAPLERLFDLAWRGTGMRDARPNTLSVDADWTAVERSFVVKRRARPILP
jgi:hypothetical protein